MSVSLQTQKWLASIYESNSSTQPASFEADRRIASPDFLASRPPATPNDSDESKPFAIPPPKYHTVFRVNKPDAWRPPDAWDCSPTVEIPPPLASDDLHRVIDNSDNDMSMDLASMQREVKRMASASPQIILLRLKEQWGCVQDATFYRELEMEKKRWMLSALNHVDVARSGVRPAQPPSLAHRNQKILALFESKGESNLSLDELIAAD
jgi:hypothetical protein